MKALLAAFILFFLAVFPVASLAFTTGAAVTSVYVYEKPKVSVSLERSDGSLICAWDISDPDKNDTFTARIAWLKNGAPVLNESIDCGRLRNCAALGRPVPVAGENWKCLVNVTDSFNATGVGSAEFQLTPLGFFDGLIRSLLSLFRF
jgi:hypothetical protein